MLGPASLPSVSRATSETMPPRRLKLRRTPTLSGSFYDKSGTIIADSAVTLPSPTMPSFPSDISTATANGRGREEMDQDSDDEYTLTGYGELSTDEPFMLPPSPTQTIKYRYRVYRPKLARLGKKYRAAAGGKTKSSAYHASELSSILGQHTHSTRSPKRDFQALMHKYRDSAEGWRGDSTAYVSPRRMGSERIRPAASSPLVPTSTPLRRSGSGVVRSP